jgi:hypothetical protein
LQAQSIDRPSIVRHGPVRVSHHRPHTTRLLACEVYLGREGNSGLPRELAREVCAPSQLRQQRRHGPPTAVDDPERACGGPGSLRRFSLGRSHLPGKMSIDDVWWWSFNPLIFRAWPIARFH